MNDRIRSRIHAMMPAARTELAELVALRSVADPRQYPAEECAKAAEWVRDRFTELGFDDARLEITPDGTAAVVGSRPASDPDTPTVLLYAHYDVQPPLDPSAWKTPPFALTDVGDRWAGRGAADCKGNILMHLLALRALGDDIPAHLKLVVEGSEEQGTGGLERYVEANPEVLRADVILVADTGNAAVGRPATTVSLRGFANVVVRVEALASEIHSGMFGGPAPDALAALIAILASLRDDAGATTIDGLDDDRRWTGEAYDPERFRSDAGVLAGVDLLGRGTVADELWARPVATVLGIDCPPVVGSTASIVPRAAARVNLRVPPGVEAQDALTALVAHIRAHAPWNVRVEVETEAVGEPFLASTDGPAYRALADAMRSAYGIEQTMLGQGGSIPLCNVFAATYPSAEIVLIGVEEPLALIHAPNESVDPTEIENLAVAEALFLDTYGRSSTH